MKNLVVVLKLYLAPQGRSNSLLCWNKTFPSAESLSTEHLGGHHRDYPLGQQGLCRFPVTGVSPWHSPPTHTCWHRAETSRLSLLTTGWCLLAADFKRLWQNQELVPFSNDLEPRLLAETCSVQGFVPWWCNVSVRAAPQPRPTASWKGLWRRPCSRSPPLAKPNRSRNQIRTGRAEAAAVAGLVGPSLFWHCTPTCCTGDNRSKSERKLQVLVLPRWRSPSTRTVASGATFSKNQLNLVSCLVF